MSYGKYPYIEEGYYLDGNRNSILFLEIIEINNEYYAIYRKEIEYRDEYKCIAIQEFINTFDFYKDFTDIERRILFY